MIRVVDHAGDGMIEMSQLIATAAIQSDQLDSLCINQLNDFSSIAPHLASFSQLTTLSIVVCGPWCYNVRGWSRPNFKLSNLTFHYSTPSAEQHSIDLTQFPWLTTSSRPSLLHLDLAGFATDIATDVGEWAGQLKTLHFALFDRVSDDGIQEVISVVSAGLSHLVLVAAGRGGLEEESDQEECDEFEARLVEAAAVANQALGRPLVQVRV